MPPEPGISVVVPVYNGAGTLRQLVARLEPVLREAAGESFEVILVDDGSRDASWTLIEELSAAHSWIDGVTFLRNYGQHNAVLCGIRLARYDAIVTMDDDLQHPPEELPKLLAKLAEGHDVVYGTPEKKAHGFFRVLAATVTKIVLKNAMGADNARDVSAWRVFRTQVRDAFANYNSPLLSIDVLLTWGTTRFAALRVRHDPRTVGTTNYTLKKLFVHALNMLTGFSTLPLTIAVWMGFGLTFFGAGVLAYVLVRYMIQGSPVQGFPFLASIISIFSGTQLFVLGIIGEYLARMHVRMQERPVYTIRATSRPS